MADRINLGLFSLFYFNYLLSASFRIIPSLQIRKARVSISSFIFFVLTSILSGLLLYSIINMDKLKRMNGDFKYANRQAVKDLTFKLGWNLRTHNQQLSVISPP